MLKWTVNYKRNSEKFEPLLATNPTGSSPGKPKRRRRSSASRRSSICSKRTSTRNGVDKENQFTSTPIKTNEDHAGVENILRDVSNLTPKDTTNKKRASILKKSDEAGYLDFANKQKKKKKCLDPAHSKEVLLFDCDSGGGGGGCGKNSFKPFESVDSHIRSFHVPKEEECPKNFAPTLPSFVTSYSPCRTKCLKSYNRCPSLPKPSRTKTNQLNLEELYPPNKKPKIDHVNDFLHRISLITSPEDERVVLRKRNVPIGSTCEVETVKISPLVQRLVDLRFSRISPDEKKDDLNDSSLINELSIDDIVNAILDSSCEISDKENEATTVQKMEEPKKEEVSFKSSSDSGFKSTSTENPHQIGSNYKCKCSKISPNGDVVTVVDTGATFNERCVDVPSRKRPSVITKDCETVVPPKRSHLDTSSSEEKASFTLKRQRCIRRRKGESSVKKLQMVQSNNPEENSFESWCSSGKPGLTESTPKEQENRCSSSDAVCDAETPTEVFKNIRRTRRCLLFESPKNNTSGHHHSPFNVKNHDRGTLELNIQYQNGEVVVNGE